MKKPSRHSRSRREKPDRSDRSFNRGSGKGPARSDRQDARAGERSNSRRQPRLSREVAVLYEDEAVIVLNKPAGLLAVPIKGSDVPSALSLLIVELKPHRRRAVVQL